jgi:tartrate/fumarate subfamily iron-sulfur-dependent hydro-lyase beta chain
MGDAKKRLCRVGFGTDGIMKTHQLNTPLTRESIEALNAGDSFMLSGRMFTCRPLAYDRLLNPGEGEGVLKELKSMEVNAVFHCGPLVKKEGDEWKILGMVPMPSWLAGPERISKAIPALGLRLVIGKGSLHGLGDVLAESGCVHAVCTGNYNDYGLKVKRVLRGYWPELGLPEALWLFEAEDFGPFIVETDVKGRSLYKGGDDLFKAEAAEVLRELGIKLD